MLLGIRPSERPRLLMEMRDENIGIKIACFSRGGLGFVAAGGMRGGSLARDFNFGGASEREERGGKEGVLAGKTDKVFKTRNPFFEVDKEAGEARGGGKMGLVEEISTEIILGGDEGLVTAVGFRGIEVFSLNLFQAVGEA